jgi:hypothetical protein
MPANFGKLIARKQRQTAKTFFGDKTGAFLGSQIEPPPLLTMSNITVFQPLNPPSSQGFSPLRGPQNPIVLLSGNRKKQNT